MTNFYLGVSIFLFILLVIAIICLEMRRRELNKFKKIDSEIIEARKNLRKIFQKYSDELFGIIKKIDDSLKVLQK